MIPLNVRFKLKELLKEVASRLMVKNFNCRFGTSDISYISSRDVTLNRRGQQSPEQMKTQLYGLLCLLWPNGKFTGLVNRSLVTTLLQNTTFIPGNFLRLEFFNQILIDFVSF